MNKVLLWKYLSLLVAILAIGYIGFYVGVNFQRQTLYQSYGFNVERSLTILEYLHSGNIQEAKNSLELSLGVGVALLPKEDVLMTDLSKWYVNRALIGAKCYGEKNSWSNHSPEFTNMINEHLKEKLINDKACSLTHHSSGTPSGAP